MRKSMSTRLALVLPFDPLRQRPLVVNEHMKISGNSEEPFKHDRIREMAHCHGAFGDLEFPLAFEEHKRKVRLILKKQEEETCKALFPDKPKDEIFLDVAKEVFIRRTTRAFNSHQKEFEIFVGLLKLRYGGAKVFPRSERVQKKLRAKQGKLFDSITDANKKDPYTL